MAVESAGPDGPADFFVRRTYRFGKPYPEAAENGSLSDGRYLLPDGNGL